MIFLCCAIEACVLTIVNDGDDLELFVATDGSEAILISPGDKTKFGDAAEPAKFYRFTQQTDGSLKPVQFAKQIACSGGHKITLTLSALNACNQGGSCDQAGLQYFSVQPYKKIAQASEGDEHHGHK
jgi:hypothetical protein